MTGRSALDESDAIGMDALHESDEFGRETARSRTAPAFCQPRPVSPRPYQSPGPVPSHEPSAIHEAYPSHDLAPSHSADGEAPPAASRTMRWRDVLARSRETIAAVSTPTQSAPVQPITVPTWTAPAVRPDSRSVAPAETATPLPRAEARSQPVSAVSRQEPQAVVTEQARRPIWDDVPAETETERDEPADTGPAWAALGRGVALLLGTLLVVDLFAAGGLPAAGPWWLDTRPLPEAAAAALLGLSAVVLIVFAARPQLPGPIRTAALLCVGLMIAIALKNATVYYGLLKRGDLHSGPPVAFSLHIAGSLGLVMLSLRTAGGPGGLRGTLLVLAGFNAALITLPIAHIACIGPIDARRPASAAIVWGPRPFEHNADERTISRVEQAAELYQRGIAGRLLFVGELEGDRRQQLQTTAEAGGVPAEAFEVLPAQDQVAMFAELRARYPDDAGITPTLLAVSDADHLPRLVMAARHADLELTPVPAASSRPPDRQVVLREIVELWRCYFRR